MSTVTRIYLVRHGEVSADWRQRIYGDLDVPLSENGEEQSRRVAAIFDGTDLDAVLSSGLARAEFAAAILRGTRGLARRDEPRLREIFRGDWAGLDRAGVEALEPGAWDEWWARDGLIEPPGGERLHQVAARVEAALADLAAEFAGGRVAVVAHKWVLRAASCAAFGLPPEGMVRFEVPYVGAIALDWPTDGGRPDLAAFGITEL